MRPAFTRARTQSGKAEHHGDAVRTAYGRDSTPAASSFAPHFRGTGDPTCVFRLTAYFFSITLSSVCVRVRFLPSINVRKESKRHDGFFSVHVRKWYFCRGAAREPLKGPFLALHLSYGWPKMSCRTKHCWIANLLEERSGVMCRAPRAVRTASMGFWSRPPWWAACSSSRS